METRMTASALHQNFGTRLAFLSAMQCILAFSSTTALAANEAEKTVPSTAQIQLALTGSALWPVEACLSGSCKHVAAPQDMLNEIENGYSKLSLDDLTMDGVPELVLTHAEEGNVNACSEIYQYDSNKSSFIKLQNVQNQICNHEVTGNRIISKYRTGAKWHEDFYTAKNGRLVLEASDSCVGCDHIERTLYLLNGRTEHVLVTDNAEYNLRVPVSATITSRKALLHSEPRNSQPTKMYLVEGDKVTLTEFTEAEDGSFWYRVRYITTEGKKIVAWMSCSDLRISEI